MLTKTVFTTYTTNKEPNKTGNKNVFYKQVRIVTTNKKANNNKNTNTIRYVVFHFACSLYAAKFTKG